MSTRQQIVMSEAEAASLRQVARRDGLTVSEWSRRALRAARNAQAVPSPATKLQALERALGCNHPTGDIDEMLTEIERGRDLAVMERRRAKTALTCDTAFALRPGIECVP